MLPQTQPRKKRNSSKVNLAISFAFHALLVLAVVYFAAREGFLGKKIQKISVQMIKEKPPEKPKPPAKPKPQPPKIAETPKPQAPNVVETTKPVQAPAPVAPPVVAPPNNELPAFQFSGGKAVDTESDPIQLYKGYMEFVLREKWDRPDNLDDADYVAEVRVHVDKEGDLSQPVWLKGSGNAQWDDSVKEVFQIVKDIGRPPPTNFPPQVTVRFDTVEETEPVFQ
ncbi:MAG: TonB C-terminal domain-containing protein [Verrucomicrobiota bacterium]|nr:TonB C-terminal domain-containing protein [Verrucomicrobiota bacterium]